MVIPKEKILILGAAGFLGTAMSQFCIQQGLITIGIDIVAPYKNIAYSSFYRTDQLESDLRLILEKYRPTYLINLAGNADVGKSLIDPRNDFRKSADLFSQILDNVRRFSIDTKVLYASSAAIYGQPKRLPILETETTQPISPYGYHKWMCELMAKEYNAIYGVKTASMRIFSAFGNGLRKQIFWDLSKKCCSSKIIELAGDGSESRDFIHVKDISIASMCILRSADFVGESYNVATGKEITISHLAQQVLDEFGIPVDRLRFSGSGRPGDPKNWRADISMLKSIGFEPTVEFSRGVEEYVKWFKHI